MANPGRPKFSVLPGGLTAEAEQQAERDRILRFSRAVDAFVSHYLRTAGSDLSVQDTITSLLGLAAGLATVVNGATADDFAGAAGVLFEREQVARAKPGEG